MKSIKNILIMLIIIFSVGLTQNISLAEGCTIRISETGNTFSSDVLPVKVNDTQLYPLRSIAEALGAEVGWNEENKTVTVKNFNTDAVININSEECKVNNIKVKLEISPQLIDNRTMVSKDFIQVSLGYGAEYNSNNTIVLSNHNASEDVVLNYSKLLNDNYQKFSSVVEYANKTPELISIYNINEKIYYLNCYDDKPIEVKDKNVKEDADFIITDLKFTFILEAEDSIYFNNCKTTSKDGMKFGLLYSKDGKVPSLVLIYKPLKDNWYYCYTPAMG